MVLSATLLLSFAGATPAVAQLTTTLSTRTLTAPVDSTVDKLTKRVEALENTIAQLQQKLAFIKSVNPLMIDPGADVYIRGTHISVDASVGLEMRAATGLAVKSGNQIYLDATGLLDLKGSSVRLNGGGVPVACALSTVNGQTATGGGLRGAEHTHGVALPVTACSSTVTVPGPGQ
jgi:hypothetical protein